MNFSPGQVVVHPHHGPATIAKIANRKIRNSTVRYLKLEVDELSVAIPVDRAEEMGVRALIDTAAVREVFATLTAESEPNETVWSRRMKQNTTRLRSGDINTVAGLVIHETQTIPEEKQAFTFHGMRFVVLKRDRNRITSLRIKPVEVAQTKN